MNHGERGVHQLGERLTRREALPRIAGLVAAALVLTGGCVEVDPPQPTGREGNDASEPPFIDAEAARDLLALYIAGVVLFGAATLFPPKIR